MSLKEEQISGFLSAFPGEFINLGYRERKISVQIYRLLAEGTPVAIEKVAAKLEVPNDDVTAVINGWPGVYYDDSGSIAGYWGLTVREMQPHRFLVNGKTLYTWCAWDSLFIPQIIGKIVQVDSIDPLTGERIQLSVSPADGFTGVNPAGTVVSFLLPEMERIRTDIITSFCHYVHFFSSDESAAKWISKSEMKEEMLILSLEEAYDIGLKKNGLQYKNL